MVNILKEKLIEEIEKLPEDRIQEVLDFVGYLRTKEAKEVLERVQEGLDPQKDPILKFIGGVSHGSLAHEIDKELYGSRCFLLTPGVGLPFVIGEKHGIRKSRHFIKRFKNRKGEFIRQIMFWTRHIPYF